MTSTKKAAAPPPLTDRQQRALDLLRTTTGGLHVDSVAYRLRVSQGDAREALRELEARKLAATYPARIGGTQLWRQVDG